MRSSWGFLLMLSALAQAVEFPDGLIAPAPPWPPQPGRVVNVADVAAFRKAVEQAKDGDQIVLAPGTYRCVPYVWMRNKKNITIRSATNDPASVKLTGKGWDQGGDHDNEDIFWLDGSENITFAHLTFTEVHAYGLKINAESKPKNIKIYNCHFRDIGIRGIKGTGGEAKDAGVYGGEVRYCRFENTKIPPKSWQFEGDYITSIDMMRLRDWTFADNVFVNIKGRNGLARGAIFVWVDSHNVIAERNLMLDCDRGICFGNASNNRSVEQHMRGGIVRNNFIVGSASESGIEISWADGTKVCHNTVVKTGPDGHLNRAIRVIKGTQCKNLEICNNLYTGRMWLEDKGAVKEANNILAKREWFADVAKADLRLTPLALAAIDKATALAEVQADFFGALRSGPPDVGAAELGSKRTAAAANVASSKPADQNGNPISNAFKNAREQHAATPKAAAPKPIEAGPHREALEKLLQGGATKKGAAVYLRIFGRPEEVVFQGGDAIGITVKVKGNALPLRWKDLSNEDLAQMSLALLPDSAEALYHGGALAAAAKLETLREKIHYRLLEVSPEKAKGLDELAGR